MATRTDTPELIADDTIQNIVRAAMMAALIGALSYVSFPFPVSPVPITLQVLGVFLAGLLLGPVWGGGAVILYLTAGAMGAPVFSMGNAGIGIIVGERGGFLLAFPVAAAVIGYLVHGGSEVDSSRFENTPRLVVAMVVGVAIIYAGGVTGLMIVLSLSLWEAFVMGALVFLPAEGAKLLAAIGIVRADRLSAV